MNQNHIILPADLYLNLLHSNFKTNECIDDRQITISKMKNQYIQEITKINEETREFIWALQRRKTLEEELQELLRKRKNIQSQHKIKRVKYDHYHYPYRSTNDVKRQLDQARMDNIEKKKKIRELQQTIIQLTLHSKIQKKETFKIREEKEGDQWMERMDRIKERYLTGESAFRRSKIKHDYNLWVQGQRSSSVRDKACRICSPARSSRVHHLANCNSVPSLRQPSKK